MSRAATCQLSRELTTSWPGPCTGMGGGPNASLLCLQRCEKGAEQAAQHPEAHQDTLPVMQQAAYTPVHLETPSMRTCGSHHRAARLQPSMGVKCVWCVLCLGADNGTPAARVQTLGRALQPPEALRTGRPPPPRRGV